MCILADCPIRARLEAQTGEAGFSVASLAHTIGLAGVSDAIPAGLVGSTKSDLAQFCLVNHQYRFDATLAGGKQNHRPRSQGQECFIQ
jgi:hypothetical protein